MQEPLTLKDKIRIRLKSQREFPVLLILVMALVLSAFFALLVRRDYQSLELNPAEVKSLPLADQVESTAVASSEIPEEITVNFYGNLQMNAGLRQYLKKADYRRFFSQLMPLLSEAQFNIINLDSPAELDGDAPEAFSKSDIEALRSLNFRIFPLANSNFCPLKGEPSDLLLAELSQLPIDFIGFGENNARAAAGQRLPYGDRAVRLFSTSAYGRNQRASYFESGMSIATDIQVFDRVTSAKVRGEYVIVMIHWGNLYNSRLGDYQAELARRYVDAGADLVIGSSPGPAATIEEYKQGLICYNLGSLQQTPADGLLRPGFVLSLTLSEAHGPELEFIPFSQHIGLPAPISQDRYLETIREQLEAHMTQFHMADGSAGRFILTEQP